MMWVRTQTVARLLDWHRDTVASRGMPWQPQASLGLFRFKNLKLEQNTRAVPRYFWPDVQLSLGLQQDRPESQDLPLAMRIIAAARFLDLARDAIEDRLILWQPDYVPYRIRCLPESKPKHRF